MPLRIERTTHIERPVDEVFAFVADMRNDPTWCKRVLSCEQVEGDGPGAGARYRAVHRPQRLRPAMDLDIRVESFERPHRMAVVERDSDGEFRVDYELRAEDGGTRIIQRDEVELPGVPRLLRPLGRITIGRHLTEQFAALKRELERPAPGG